MTIAYDMLVVDLDGTLMRRDGTVSRANRAALDAAREAGLEVIIATGRSLSECQAVLAEMKPAQELIAAGGSLLCDLETGATIQRFILDASVVRAVSDALLEDGHRVLLLKDRDASGYDYLTIGSAPLDPASQWWFEHHPVVVKHVADYVDEHPQDTLRAGAVACGTRLAPLAARLHEAVGERAALQHWAAVTAAEATGSSTHLLEVFGPGVNKWTMVQRLCQLRGLGPQRVAAIGDGLNDVELLRGAALGVAMANADPRARRVCNRTTGDQDADGVALAIEHILAGRW